MKDYKKYYTNCIIKLAKENNLKDYDTEDKISLLNKIQLIKLWGSLRWTYGDLSRSK